MTLRETLLVVVAHMARRLRWLAVLTVVLASSYVKAGAADCPRNRALGLDVGINILGYSKYWTGGRDSSFRLDHLRTIREAGFDFVRVNATFLSDDVDADVATHRLILNLERVLAAASDVNLAVVVNAHDSRVCVANLEMCRSRLLHTWLKIAEHFRGRFDRALFEPLNEPHGALDGPVWNEWLEDLLPQIQNTDPARWIIVDTSKWGTMAGLDALKLPAQRGRVAVSVHYYEPHEFTHQGTPWSHPSIRNTSGLGLKDGFEDTLAADFDRLVEWGRRNDVPLFLGEFGVYDTVPIALRASYISSVSNAASSRCIARSLWQFGRDFRAFDFGTNEWLEEILRSVIPR